MEELSNRKLDFEALTLLRRLPRLPFYAPINIQRHQAQKAIDALERGESPSFSHGIDHPSVRRYKTRIDETRQRIQELRMDPIVTRWYTAYIDERLKTVDLLLAVAERDDVSVTQMSASLFSVHEPDHQALDQEAETLIHETTTHPHSKPVDAAAFAHMCELMLQAYDMQGWRIRSTQKPSVYLSYAHKQPSIYVPQSLKISRARARRLLTHEIEVHALRSHNSRTSPIGLVAMHLDHYLSTEEGLATYFQTAHRKKVTHAAGFWDSWAASLAYRYPAHVVFTKLKDAKHLLLMQTDEQDAKTKSIQRAWNLCAKIYRGIHNPSVPGRLFTKPLMYRQGLEQVSTAIASGGQDIVPLLFHGNVGLHHLHDLRTLGLAPGQVPQLMSREIVRIVMESGIDNAKTL